MSKNLIIVVTDEEYKDIHKEAENNHMSASLYIKSKWYNKDYFAPIKNNKLPIKSQCTLEMIYGLDNWSQLSKEEKLAISRSFNKYCEFYGFKCIGRNSSNVSIYEKF